MRRSPNHPGTDDADDGSLIPAAELPRKRRGTPPTEEYLRAKAEGLLLEPMTLEARLAARQAPDARLSCREPGDGGAP